QELADQAANALDTAVQTFTAAVNTTASIEDLALLGMKYGLTSASPDWQLVNRYDWNSDHKITIVDLAVLASKIGQ
ncbi:hypothetical protein K0U00_21845, partial [Paenibacillus sepulcri]|nr:hypothetical protein [Paenibacillus sepulcri]